jgi:hypothetical protein
MSCPSEEFPSEPYESSGPLTPFSDSALGNSAVFTTNLTLTNEVPMPVFFLFQFHMEFGVYSMPRFSTMAAKKNTQQNYYTT